MSVALCTRRAFSHAMQRCVSNVVDFYGSTDFNWWWENNFGGAPLWDDLDNYFASRR